RRGNRRAGCVEARRVARPGGCGLAGGRAARRNARRRQAMTPILDAVPRAAVRARRPHDATGARDG
ncbi:MAG: hypothetical protein KDF63_07405, partial [Rhodoferax sp.]|nr:hypothetical protein [Rhodoferax sp.]